MHDSSKRNTLKLLGGSTAGVFLPSSLVLAEAATRAAGASQFPAAAKRTPELLINLFRSTAVPDDTFMLQNQSSERLVISRFLPGTVIFDDVQVDLNEAVDNTEVILEPHQVMSLRAQLSPINSDDVMEYVWANSAVDSISDNLSIVSIGAFMVDGQAILYPQNTPSVQTSFLA